MQRIFQSLTGRQTSGKEARNGLRHIASLSMTKLADGLIDPKLVLSWLLGVLGVPAALIGMLVPIREAGALLPQVFLAGRVQRMRRRKWAWVAGSAGQGVAAAAIAAAALTLDGTAAGLAVCAALAGLAVSRAACSVSYKDVLGKTVGQTRRGSVTGLAGSISASAVLIFAVLLVTGLLRSQSAIIGAVLLAAALWLLAATAFSRLREAPSTPQAPASAGAYREILREDANLRRFILVRGLLVSTALAPPYMVLLMPSEAAATGQLGALVLASSAASFGSSYLWGRFADRDSPRVMLWAGLIAALAMGAAMLVAAAGLASGAWAMPMVLFVLMVAYHGVRQARSTYLVDISPEDRRSVNAALSNTAIGLILLLAGAVGGALSWLGPMGALAGFAAMALAGGLLALTLREVGS